MIIERIKNAILKVNLQKYLIKDIIFEFSELKKIFFKSGMVDFIGQNNHFIK